MKDGILLEFIHIIEVHLDFVVEAGQNLNKGYLSGIERPPNLFADGEILER